jgi:hypothetical protein
MSGDNELSLHGDILKTPNFFAELKTPIMRLEKNPLGLAAWASVPRGVTNSSSISFGSCHYCWRVSQAPLEGGYDFVIEFAAERLLLVHVYFGSWRVSQAPLEGGYDFVICGLPFNNFPLALTQSQDWMTIVQFYSRMDKLADPQRTAFTGICARWRIFWPALSINGRSDDREHSNLDSNSDLGLHLHL